MRSFPKYWSLVVLVTTLSLSSPGSAFAAPPDGRLAVVATLPDLADIAQQVGGEKVSVTSIAVGYQDPHYVDPKPSFIVKLNKADVFIQVGLDLEIGWVPPLLNQSRNTKILRGGEGWIDASRGIAILQKPTRQLSRAEGDIHIYGNPHYWVDPLNGKIIAAHVATVFSRLRPQWKPYFDERLEDFRRRVDRANEIWQAKMKPYNGVKVIAYHNSWPYFAERFGLDVVGYVEPKPGIPPSPGDLIRVLQQMKNENIRVILHSVYYDDKPSRFIADKTNAEVVTLATSVGGAKGVDDYIALSDYNIDLLVKYFQEMNVKGAVQ